MTCPCKSKKTFEECCGRFLEGESVPQSAEELMRSRYSAYTRAQIDYIVSTHDAATRDEVDTEAALAWAESAAWLGLDVVRCEKGGPNDQSGVIEFVARYQAGPKIMAHHEVSNFKKEGERWFYVDGEIVVPKPMIRDSPKVGRNEKCPCGSGAKYKKCCGKAA